MMVLLLWINGCRHGFTTDEGFDLVVGVAADTVDLLDSAAEIPRICCPGSPPASLKGGVDNVPFISYWAKQPSDWPGFRMLSRVPSLCKAWNVVRVPPRDSVKRLLDANGQSFEIAQHAILVNEKRTERC
jgi:hypothetical protein